MSVNTQGQLIITSSWTQTSVDDVVTSNTVEDAGQLSYQRTYLSGTATGTVSQIFNQVSTLASGGSGNFNLTGLVQNILGNNTIKSFTGINSITIQNRSTRPGFDININVSSSSGFKQPFGYPTGVIVLKPGSCIHANTAAQDWPVGATSKQLLLNDGGSGAAYSISLYGHQ
jgi:hypothetical protein